MINDENRAEYERLAKQAAKTGDFSELSQYFVAELLKYLDKKEDETDKEAAQ